jgi:hypothetical protein
MIRTSPVSFSVKKILPGAKAMFVGNARSSATSSIEGCAASCGRAVATNVNAERTRSEPRIMPRESRHGIVEGGPGEPDPSFFW